MPVPTIDLDESLRYVSQLLLQQKLLSGDKERKKRYRTSKRVPILMTTEIIPYACSELLKCGCKTMKCTFPCTCSRNRIQCLFACCCKAECSNTHNPATNLDNTNYDDEDNAINNNSVLFVNTN